jgi:hypothetical protein
MEPDLTHLLARYLALAHAHGPDSEPVREFVDAYRDRPALLEEIAFARWLTHVLSERGAQLLAAKPPAERTRRLPVLVGASLAGALGLAAGLSLADRGGAAVGAVTAAAVSGLAVGRLLHGADRRAAGCPDGRPSTPLHRSLP